MEETKLLANRCVMDERTLRRTYAQIFRRTLYLFCGGAGLIAAFSLLLIVLQGGLSPLPAFLLAAAGIYLWVGLRMPGKQAKRQIRRYEESGSGDSPEVTVWFDEDGLCGSREGTENVTEIDYDSLASILPDGSRIVLWTEAKQFVVLDTARFENGSEDDFWRLMNEKCPAAVPKQYRA